tara:strand:+ start:6784 stop:7593 length:810 start_codon:yes stop_codon:yes gene_type:complete
MDLKLTPEEEREFRKDVVKQVKIHQYKELIKAKNTYNIFFNAVNADNFNGLDNTMNGMEYTIPSNNTDNIRYCKYRFKNLSLPPSGNALNFNAIHLEVEGGLVMNSGLPIKDIERQDNQNGGVYPSVVSGNEPFANAGSGRALVNRQRAGTFLLRKNRRQTTPTSNFFTIDDAGVATLKTGNPGGGNDIVGALPHHTFVGSYAEGDGEWRYGFNPFGKKLKLNFVSDLELRTDFTDVTNANNGRSGNYTLTCELEVCLLPDFMSDNQII